MGCSCPRCVSIEVVVVSDKLTAAIAALEKAVDWYEGHIKKPEDEKSNHPIACIAREALLFIKGSDGR